MREFRPNKLGLNSDFFSNVLESRLSHSGEYVFHIPQSGLIQPVVMNYQYIPQEENNEFLVSGTNPKLFGLADHFAELPRNYKEANSAKPKAGSQFEIRGLIYNVKKVDINHRGYVHIDLIRDDICAIPNDDFKDRVNLMMCEPELSCDDNDGSIKPSNYGDCSGC